MKVSIIGSGYVGLVSGAGLAQVGHDVLCVDIDADRVTRLQEGHCPIFEPGLASLLQDNIREGRLAFTTDIREAVTQAEVLLIAVGTPPREDGSADLGHVLDVARDIGQHLDRPLLVVVKSTVPVGTCDQVRDTIHSALAERGVSLDVTVASNPEFLAEGAAVNDFMKPDRIVVGIDGPAAEQTLRELYAPFNRNHEKLLCMDVRSAELTKYAANAMLATRISLMNEFANIAERVGADIEQVRQGIGSDPRIGYSFIYPGAGYGGSCFPKDVRALCHTAAEHGYSAQILEAAEAVNSRQKGKLFDILMGHYEGKLEGRTIAVWGLAFKPNTDDLREASSLVLIRALLAAGAHVRAHDPQAMPAARVQLANEDRLDFLDSPYAATESADALVLVTEWRQYWAPNFERLAQNLRQPVLVDGRNIWDPAIVRQRGFTYYGIGRR